MGSILFKPFAVDSETGVISINNFKPGKDIKAVAGATHISIKGGFVNISGCLTPHRLILPFISYNNPKRVISLLISLYFRTSLKLAEVYLLIVVVGLCY